MTHVITNLCTREGDCVEVCPVDCIIPGPKGDPDWGASFYIDPDTCIDCGACLPVCPPEATFPEEDVPAEYEADIAMNAAYFTDGPGYWDYDLDEQRHFWDYNLDEQPLFSLSKSDADVIQAAFSFGPKAKDAGWLQPYQVSTWETIPDNLKDPEGYWGGLYYGVVAFQINKSFVKNVPQDWSDLLKPDYKGQVALTGDPRIINPSETELSEAANAVYAAALGSGGSLDNAAPGLEFFKQLNESGNLVPIMGNQTTLVKGETPILLRWDYNALADKDTEIEVIIPKSGILAGVYLQAINVSVSSLSVAWQWLEFLYSDEGQLIWLKHYAHPVRFDDLYQRDLIPVDLMAKLPPPEKYIGIAFPMAVQLEAATEVIAAGWDKVVGVKLQPAQNKLINTGNNHQ